MFFVVKNVFSSKTKNKNKKRKNLSFFIRKKFYFNSQFLCKFLGNKFVLFERLKNEIILKINISKIIKKKYLIIQQ